MSQDFNLSNKLPDQNTLYIGFTGNFLGPNSQNSFPTKPDIEIANMGFSVLKQIHVLNNIADKYGQELFIAEFKK
jgi:hypothetical protein